MPQEDRAFPDPSGGHGALVEVARCADYRRDEPYNVVGDGGPEWIKAGELSLFALQQLLSGCLLSTCSGWPRLQWARAQFGTTDCLARFQDPIPPLSGGWIYSAVQMLT